MEKEVAVALRRAFEGQRAKVERMMAEDGWVEGDSDEEGSVDNGMGNWDGNKEDRVTKKRVENIEQYETREWIISIVALTLHSD